MKESDLVPKTDDWSHVHRAHYDLATGFVGEQLQAGPDKNVHNYEPGMIPAEGVYTDSDHSDIIHDPEWANDHHGHSVLVSSPAHGSTVVSKSTVKGENSVAEYTTEHSAFRSYDKGAAVPASASINRYDKDGNKIYSHAFRNPKAAKLVTKLAIKEVDRARTPRKARKLARIRDRKAQL